MVLSVPPDKQTYVTKNITSHIQDGNNTRIKFLLRPGMGEEYSNQFVCLSASVSLEPLDRCSQNFFVRRSPAAAARFSSDDVAIRYVLLLLSMTSCLAVMGRIMTHERLDL